MESFISIKSYEPLIYSNYKTYIIVEFPLLDKSHFINYMTMDPPSSTRQWFIYNVTFYPVQILTKNTPAAQ